MDFIKLYANEIRNVVATLGTSFTNEHARLLRRFCEEVVIVYDGDAAGIRQILEEIPCSRRISPARTAERIPAASPS